MIALNSHLVLIDLHTSWCSAQQISNSTFGYLQNCSAGSASFSAAIRRTRGRRRRISSSRAPVPEVRSPEIRRPTVGNGSLSDSSNTASTSSSGSRGDEVVSDMDLFLEIVPSSMKHALFRHEMIGELIEVVMDVGRKPLARFPSGDWVISEQTVKPEDLLHAISKVGKSPLFESRRLDPETNNSSKRDHVTDTKVAPQESQLVEVQEVYHEALNSLKSSEPSKEHHAQDMKVTNNEKVLTKIDSYLEDEDYSLKSKKVDSNVSSVRKRYPLYVYTYKIQEADLLQVAGVMGLEEKIDVAYDIGSADAILVSSYEMKQNPWIRGVAKFHQLPIFVIKSTTMAQMVKAIQMILGMDRKTSSAIEIDDDAPKRKPSLQEIDALEEVRLAIEYIVIPGGEPVELLPRHSDIVARQLELVRSYQLAVENSGAESNPRLHILPQKLNKRSSKFIIVDSRRGARQNE